MDSAVYFFSLQKIPQDALRQKAKTIVTFENDFPEGTSSKNVSLRLYQDESLKQEPWLLCLNFDGMYRGEWGKLRHQVS